MEFVLQQFSIQCRNLFSFAFFLNSKVSRLVKKKTKTNKEKRAPLLQLMASLLARLFPALGAGYMYLHQVLIGLLGYLRLCVWLVFWFLVV